MIEKPIPASQKRWEVLLTFFAVSGARVRNLMAFN